MALVGMIVVTFRAKILKDSVLKLLSYISFITQNIRSI